MARSPVHVNQRNLNLNTMEQTTATQPSVVCSYLAEPLSTVAVLTLNRPETRNALGPLEWQLIGQHLQAIAAEERVRVLIIRGSGSAFCAGADLRPLQEQLERPPCELQERLHEDMQVIRTLYELDRPVIAQIHGPCIGSGLALALACDLRICAASATLGVPAHRVGLTGDAGLMWLLPRVVGPARAAEMLLLYDALPATRAESLGLINRVVPDDKLADEVQTVAAKLAAGPRLAQAMTKRGLRRSLGWDLPTMLEWESQTQSILSGSEDAREGVQSILEKRKPQFRGR
jgi:enoyl-CoA hydratase/carnithine racemase